MRNIAIIILAALLSARASGQSLPTTAGVGKLPFVEVDRAKKQARVECESLHIEGPLEFFCCVTGTNEYESVLRSKVRPSHLHLALLMLGIEPGEPVHFDQANQKWVPPHGPPLHISIEFEKDGKTVVMPATKLMRDIKTKKTMPEFTWIFAGSRVMENKRYAADTTGYLVSVVNFELSVVDVPNLASNANETLEWETDPDLAPPAGAKITMVIEPADKVIAPATQPGSAGKIDVPVVKIDSGGKILLDDQEVTIKELMRRIKQTKGDRPLKVRVSAENENDAKKNVIDALKELGVEVEEVPPPTPPSP